MSDDNPNDNDKDLGNEGDVQFDRWLHASAREYNRPNTEAVAPGLRADIWREIEQSLSATASSASPPMGAVPSDVVTALPPARARRFRTPWWQMAAAALLLAAGIGIGRQWRSATEPSASVASGASSDGAAVGATDPLLPSGAVATSASDFGEASGDRRDASGRPAPTGTSRSGATSYDVAALAHLSRAEALLTSFRGSEEGSAQGGADDAPMTRWARDLLADTRLLLDSPAATDARRRALLDDLELVLAQIVQLPAESSADRSQVRRSIERGAVLSRLRSSIPAGFSSGT